MPLPPNSKTLKGQLLWWFLPGSEGGGAMGGAFLYKAKTLWGQGSTVIHFYGKPLQKPLCLIQPHSFFTLSHRPKSGLDHNASTSLLTTYPDKAKDKDKPGSELKLPGKEHICEKDTSVGLWGKDSGRPLHPRTRSVGRYMGGDPIYKERRQIHFGFWDPDLLSSPHTLRHL